MEELVMFFYLLYGSTVCSDIEFPQLMIDSQPQIDQTDIMIQAGIMPEDIKRQENGHYSFQDKRSWLVTSVSSLLVEDGRKITYELKDNCNINHLRTYILGYAISMIYLQKGEMAIHCAAISVKGQAILIAGESGSGKSTITDTLLGQGYQLMADDMAIVRVNDIGKVEATPGFPYQKLCREVVTKKGYHLDDLIYINEDKDKFLVPYQGEFNTKEKNVKAMFILVETDSVDKLFIEELKGFDKFYSCIRNLFLRNLLREHMYEEVIAKKCLEIASKMPIYLIRRPVIVNTVKEITEHIATVME
jgi:energy-coupling factor transporter ATP-binding protein EcfA2